MNIKRFVATDMREALRAVRAELGPDAVMLSSRGIDGGVEVVAAVDCDDGLLAAVGDAFAAAPSAPAADPVAEYRDIAVSWPDEGPAGDDPSPLEAGGEAESARARTAAARVALVVGGDRAARALGAPASPVVGEANPAAAGPAGPAAAVRPPAPDPLHAEAAAAPAAPEGRRGTPSVSGEPETERLRRELRDLRELLETQLASLAWNDLNRRMPARARVLRQFAAIGVPPKLARELADTMAAARNPRDAWRLPLRHFADRLPLASKDLADLGGVYAFVGPTGVGKTTTIAKIAARYVLKHGPDSIALVSTDTYRIGARDQLLTFARILGTPMHSAADARDLDRVLDGLAGKRLVLIDTAGMSQRDVRLAEQFSTLRAAGGAVRSVLVLSAATERGALDEALEVFRSADPKALVVTKVDEAALLGPVLSLAIESRLPVVYVSDGQRVPEDLHVAGSKRIWLMQTAMNRSRNRPSQLSEDELAERFGSPELSERLDAAELADA